MFCESDHRFSPNYMARDGNGLTINANKTVILPDSLSGGEVFVCTLMNCRNLQYSLHRLTQGLGMINASGNDVERIAR